MRFVPFRLVLITLACVIQALWQVRTSRIDNYLLMDSNSLQQNSTSDSVQDGLFFITTISSIFWSDQDFLVFSYECLTEIVILIVRDSIMRLDSYALG